jgi:hypothetical protein
MIIRFKRHADGSSSLTCIRSDGTSTWQRQRGSLGAVFPPHDLTHYAVETVLGYRHGFYGLIADGWEITDFAKPWPRGAIPAEAREVELIVGFFDTERRSFARMTEEEFNEHGTRTLTAAEIERVRDSRAELLRRWGALEAGGVLELPFDATQNPGMRSSAVGP